MPDAPYRHRNATVLVIAGTRPECIKLAPLVRRLATRSALRTVLVNSGQHAGAVRQTFGTFGIRCDLELAPLPPLPSLGAACRAAEAQLATAIARVRPAVVVVQGDTLTAFAGARAGHLAGRPVAHVEAGLRTDSASDPFPEEWFRRRIARYAALHFAPSRSAESNLVAEGVDRATIHRVGNTGIDTLRTLLEQRGRHEAAGPRNRVLVTLHRRENWDGRADIVCDALIELASRRPELAWTVPVHPNPRVANRIRRRLEGRAGFRLVAPMSYPEFIGVAADAALIISDSGGIQEEAPHLGVPLLVPRSNTERPEGIATGFVRLVPTDRTAIVREALAMLAAPRGTALPFDDRAPFGAGDAAARIVDVLEAVLLEDSRLCA
jgi:UDP-N-acetylglucosamine 2-epimerase (non-hydrolysing)